MTHYIGLDAHSKTCTAVVTDFKGTILKKSVFPTTERDLKSFIDSVKRPRRLAFEEMNIAQWLYVLLKDDVDEIQIAHAAHLTKQRGAKTDYIDAVRLATELRNGTITQVFHADNAFFDLRQVVKSHQDVTQDLVRAKNRYKSFLRSKGKFVSGAAIYDNVEVRDSFEKEHEKFIATNNFEQIRSLAVIKALYEKKLAGIAKQWPKIQSLCSIPGISHIRATMIMAIVCSGDRFADKHKFWSYCCLVRHSEISDGKVYGNRKAKGSLDLKCVFMGAAVSVLVGQSSLRKYYDRLRTKGESDRDARKAVARKIAAIALMTMKTGVAFDDHHDLKGSRLAAPQ